MGLQKATAALERLAKARGRQLDNSFAKELESYRLFLKDYGVSDAEFEVVAIALGAIGIEHAKIDFITDKHLDRARMRFGCSKANADCYKAAAYILDRSLTLRYKGGAS